MFVVKYDTQSMVKLIQCIAKHSLLYDTNHVDYSVRSEQDKAWKSISQEVEESESLCRDRWRSIRACYGRYLRNRNLNRKPYYLAEYLDFLLPFTSASKSTNVKRIENGNSVGTTYSSSGEESVSTPHLQDIQDNTDSVFYDYDDIFEELYVDLTSDKPIAFPLKRRRTSWSPILDEGNGDVKIILKDDSSSDQAASSQKKIIDCSDPNITFFRRILPEIARMTSMQNLQFKQSVLRILNDILCSNEEKGEDEEEEDDEDDEEEEEGEEAEEVGEGEGEEEEEAEEEGEEEEEEEVGEGEEEEEEKEKEKEEEEEDHAKQEVMEVNNPQEPGIKRTVDTNVESEKETDET